MIWLLSILAFIVIFSFLILMHEFGHFYVARKCGIKVQEFGMGMPPRIWGFKPKKSETLYSINAIPFGGFVRLYGEDVYDKKALKSKKSFASKAPWQKVAVAGAGVFLNILLAYVLLVIGFSIGMQPLLVTPEDVYGAIDTGVVKIEEGIVVKDVGENDIGFLAGDNILMVNDVKVEIGNEVMNLKDQEVVKFEIKRGEQIISLKGVNDISKPFFVGYDLLPLPRLVVKGVKEGSTFGLVPGDVIMSVNKRPINSTEQLIEELVENGGSSVEVRKSAVKNGPGIGLENIQPVIISMVEVASGAEQVGIKEGDEIISINGVRINEVGDLSTAVQKEVVEDKAVYIVRRGESEVEFYARKDEFGKIGVMLSETEYLQSLGLVVYSKSVPYSVLKIEDVSYPVPEAAWQGIAEVGRLSVLTMQMFAQVFESIFTRLAVPDGVAGPVGIAQMTFIFVQEGIMSLLRFTALLSLSLAIINILPFPGLDGGRIFLILIPAIFGKKLNPRWEAAIHVVGFLILMLMILLVTYNDILRLFS